MVAVEGAEGAEERPTCAEFFGCVVAEAADVGAYEGDLVCGMGLGMWRTERRGKEVG